MKRPISSVNVFTHVGELLDKIDSGKLRLIESPKPRLGAYFYPAEVLKSKLLLERGLLEFDMQKYSSAMATFVACLQSGTIYEAKTQKLCYMQI